MNGVYQHESVKTVILRCLRLTRVHFSCTCVRRKITTYNDFSPLLPQKTNYPANLSVLHPSDTQFHQGNKHAETTESHPPAIALHKKKMNIICTLSSSILELIKTTQVSYFARHWRNRLYVLMSMMTHIFNKETETDEEKTKQQGYSLAQSGENQVVL